MKKPEEILAPFIERPFRHTEVVEKDNAITAMKQYADQFRGLTWISISDQIPPEYERVLYFNKKDSEIGVGYFVWSQTPVDYVSHWMRLPGKPKS